MRAIRGANLGEAKGPSHPVQLVRFEFVGELAELSLLGVLKHVGMQRLEFVSNSALLRRGCPDRRAVSWPVFSRGVSTTVSPPLISRRALGWTVSSSAAFVHRGVAGAGRRRPRAVVAPGSGDVGEQFLDLLVLSGQERNDVALVRDID